MPNGAGSCPDFRLVEGSSLSIRRTLTPEGCRCLLRFEVGPARNVILKHLFEREHNALGAAEMFTH